MKEFLSRENTSLTVSVIIAALFAAAGIGLGLWMDSLMILFDGAYSLISLVLSMLALYVARLVRQPGNRHFPFGYAALEPLVIAVKGVTITLLCLVSLASALHALLTGGSQIDLDIAIAFTMIGLIACFSCTVYLRWSLARNESGLVAADFEQWRMDTVLSVAILLGFAAAYALERTAWADWAVYADPAMVALVAGYFIWVPLRMTSAAVRELVLAAPPAAMREEVLQATSDLGLPSEAVRMTKVGPYLVLELLVTPSEHTSPEALRFGLYRRLAHIEARPVVLMRASSGADGSWPWLDTPGERPW
ncbi:cobalt-zinc-cadmium resistance protein [Halorhodospira halochloris]|uniref:Cobalt-zinc-cadmium resistance protein n=1 Tax=Halorhodospira halochloris TaxID=1052 RepID=A0A0X8XB97_HALHR|nr:cation diffusion facilitator family transporter [Halorhodospira halochloris]MBK1651885.1 cation transporter [Halorhodospira halochloris]BAU58775.1 cobalt-zinc-cadmium resistance protein [Halorhodospira halochloris]